MGEAPYTTDRVSSVHSATLSERRGLVRQYKRQVLFRQLLFRALESLAAAIFGAVILERCNFNGTRALWQWLSQSKGLIIPGILALICFYNIIRVFIWNPVAGFGVYGFLVCFVGASHFYKLNYRLEPLLPYDFFNIGTALSIAGKMNIPFDRGLMFHFLILILCLLVMLYVSRRYYVPVSYGLVWNLTLVPVLSACCLMILINIPRLEAFGALDIRYEQMWNYRHNGFMAASLINLTDRGIKAPKGYGEKAIGSLKSEIINAGAPAPLGKPGSKPHIIALQMETYADPAFIDARISYETNPFEPLKSRANNISAFRVLTSVLGGGTANTEYEFLTGFNMYFCPMGVIPFTRYLNSPRQSLASELTDMGYSAIATHPNKGSFYERDKAFSLLGFQRFVTWEEYDAPEYIGGYISDASFVNKIIELYEQEKEDGPLFIYGISIQNHGPYDDPERYRIYPVNTGDTRLSGPRVRELETFGANIRDSSVALARIMEYFSKVNEPVLILVYGDHQAAWGWALEKEGSADLELRRYSAEGFFWANYPIDKRIRPIISVSGLAPYVMRMAGLDLPLYFRGIDLQFSEIMAYNTSVIVENDGSASYADRDRLERSRALQYDRMFGKNYLNKDSNF